MAYPVIANVFRCALHYRNDDYPEGAVNVIHVLSETGDEEDVFNAIDDGFEFGQLSMVGDGTKLYRIAITKLDGDVNTAEFNTDNDAKWNGSAGSQSIPTACALIKLTTGGGGRSGRGRIYLPYLGEAEVDGGVLADADRSACEGHWVNFANSLVAAEKPLVVASYKLASARQVLNVAIEARMATQRKRWHR